MKDIVKIAIIQMEIKSDIFDSSVRDDNVNRVCSLIEKVAQENENLDCIVLPEEFYAGAGYGPISLPDNINKVNEKVFSPIGKIAKKYNTYIIGELVSKLNIQEFRGNNLGFVIGRDGEVIGYQERFHQNPSEVAYSYKGNKYKVFDLDFGKIGLVLGLDILFPEISRNFVAKGAEILISPLLSPGPKRETGHNCFPNDLFMNCAVARALENQVYIIAVNGVGKFAHVELDLFGESLAASPLGKILQLGSGEEVSVVELNIRDKSEACRNYQLDELCNKEMCKILERVVTEAARPDSCNKDCSGCEFV